MNRRRVEQRLGNIRRQLLRLREELRITEEQLIPLEDAADDLKLRALVAETPLAEREYRQAARHVERLRRTRLDTLGRIKALESKQDDLLDKLADL